MECFVIANRVLLFDLCTDLPSLSSFDQRSLKIHLLSSSEKDALGMFDNYVCSCQYYSTGDHTLSVYVLPTPYQCMYI